MKDCAIDILAIQETKCTGRQAYWGWKRMVEERVVTVWADARGASGGVGLVLREKWGRHVLQTDTYKNRIVSVMLGFRHTKIRVVSVYWPASNSTEDRNAKRKCTKWIREICQRDAEKNIQSIWLGDWNSVIDEDIDAVKGSDKHDRWGVQVMEANGMLDTFRIVYPDEVMVSYLKKESQSKGGTVVSGARLDGIWVSNKLGERVVACDIQIARHTTGESDHVPVMTALDVMGLCTAAKRIQPQQRKVPHWKSSTEDQRKAYEVKATSEMKRLNARIAEARIRWIEDWMASTDDQGLHEEAEKAGCTKPRKGDHYGNRDVRTTIMNELEEILANWCRSLWHTAMSELETKTLGVPQTQPISERKLHKLKRVLGSYMMKPSHDYRAILRDIESHRTTSNHKWVNAIPEQQDGWIMWAKAELNCIKDKLEAERKRLAEEAIRTAINTRNDMFATNLKKVLDRILECTRHRIYIDKAQVAGGTEFEEVKVKNEVDAFMEKWFRERPKMIIPEGSLLHDAYKPREDISESWFDGMGKEVQLDEVWAAVRGMGQEKAPGPSGITKELIIGAGEECIKFLQTAYQVCMDVGDSPDTWAKSQCAQFPKHQTGVVTYRK
jgi:exonuclease III